MSNFNLNSRCYNLGPNWKLFCRIMKEKGTQPKAKAQQNVHNIVVHAHPAFQRTQFATGRLASICAFLNSCIASNHSNLMLRWLKKGLNCSRLLLDFYDVDKSAKQGLEPSAFSHSEVERRKNVDLITLLFSIHWRFIIFRIC